MSTEDTAANRAAAYVPIPVRFDFDALAPAVSTAVMTLHKAAIKDLAKAGVPQGLIELVRLRASQLNGCAYCVNMHSVDARKAGVSDQRVDMLPVWEDAGLYTAEERSALVRRRAGQAAPARHSARVRSFAGLPGARAHRAGGDGDRGQPRGVTQLSRCAPSSRCDAALLVG